MEESCRRLSMEESFKSYASSEALIFTTDTVTYHAEGPGLREATIREAAKFSIEALDADGSRVKASGFFVHVLGVARCRARVEALEDGMMHEVTWKPVQGGTYRICVSHYGCPLPGSPFTVEAVKPEPCAAKCWVRGSALSRVIARETSEFEIAFKDKLGAVTHAVDVDCFVEPVYANSPRATPVVAVAPPPTEAKPAGKMRGLLAAAAVIEKLEKRESHAPPDPDANPLPKGVAAAPPEVSKDPSNPRFRKIRVKVVGAALQVRGALDPDAPPLGELLPGTVGTVVEEREGPGGAIFGLIALDYLSKETTANVGNARAMSATAIADVVSNGLRTDRGFTFRSSQASRSGGLCSWIALHIDSLLADVRAARVRIAPLAALGEGRHEGLGAQRGCPAADGTHSYRAALFPPSQEQVLLNQTSHTRDPSRASALTSLLPSPSDAGRSSRLRLSLCRGTSQSVPAVRLIIALGPLPVARSTPPPTSIVERSIVPGSTARGGSTDRSGGGTHRGARAKAGRDGSGTARSSASSSTTHRGAPTNGPATNRGGGMTPSSLMNALSPAALGLRPSGGSGSGGEPSSRRHLSPPKLQHPSAPISPPRLSGIGAVGIWPSSGRADTASIDTERASVPGSPPTRHAAHRKLIKRTASLGLNLTTAKAPPLASQRRMEQRLGGTERPLEKAKSAAEGAAAASGDENEATLECGDAAVLPETGWVTLVEAGGKKNVSSRLRLDVGALREHERQWARRRRHDGDQKRLEELAKERAMNSDPQAKIKFKGIKLGGEAEVRAAPSLSLVPPPPPVDCDAAAPSLAPPTEVAIFLPRPLSHFPPKGGCGARPHQKCAGAVSERALRPASTGALLSPRAADRLRPL